MSEILRIHSILGSRTDPELAERLHELEHRGAVEHLPLATADVARKRLRAATDRGTDCAVALPRSESLFHGAVLHLDETRAVVVRVTEERWLRLVPVDDAAALELGYNAGNLHWRVRFEGPVLLVALEGPEEGYTARIAPLLESGRVVAETPP